VVSESGDLFASICVRNSISISTNSEPDEFWREIDSADPGRFLSIAILHLFGASASRDYGMTLHVPMASGLLLSMITFASAEALVMIRTFTMSSLSFWTGFANVLMPVYAVCSGSTGAAHGHRHAVSIPTERVDEPPAVPVSPAPIRTFIEAEFLCSEGIYIYLWEKTNCP